MGNIYGRLMATATNGGKSIFNSTRGKELPGHSSLSSGFRKNDEQATGGSQVRRGGSRRRRAKKAGTINYLR